MDAKDFGQLLKGHPEMLDDGKKFAAILRDIYPSEKGNVNLIITACNAGVVSMLRKSELDSLLDSRIINLLMDDYAIAEEKARWAAELWTDAYYYFRHGTLREREQPKAASSAKAEKTPEAVQAKPVETKKPSKKKSSVTSVVETDIRHFKGWPGNSGYVIVEYVGFEIEKVVIPAYSYGRRITIIGPKIFRNRGSLKSVTIPEGVTTIGAEAFKGCTRLTSVTIPDSVTSIGSEAFSGTPWLKNMGVFAVINGILLAYQGNDKSVTIPAGIRKIGDSAFRGRKGLTSVTIPQGVTEIGRNAFWECESLTSVIIPKGVTKIGGSAFCRCESLTSVTIPEGVTEIGDSAFSGCTSLKSVTIPKGVAEIGESAFTDCKSLVSVTIPQGVTEIGRNAFWECESLVSVTIPQGVTKIGGDAFYRCTNLKSVTIPEGVIEIGSLAFSNCESLVSVTIPESVTEIGGSAFPDDFLARAKLIIHAPAGSCAERYAKKKDITFCAI